LLYWYKGANADAAVPQALRSKREAILRRHEFNKTQNNETMQNNEYNERAGGGGSISIVSGKTRAGGAGGDSVGIAGVDEEEEQEQEEKEKEKEKAHWEEVDESLVAYGRQVERALIEP
jgi:hypothetical protein